MSEFNHKEIEKKWKMRWDQTKLNHPDLKNAKNPYTNLMMFPYPSAEGLHAGSLYTFTGIDTFSRFKKMQGYDVFEPFGLDGFGIHSENYAIKIGEHVRDVSKRTEKHFYEQVDMAGLMIDKDHMVETYKPNYYRWTQWLFLKMWEKGLAYRKKAMVNYCPKCKTTLSDEQVIDEKCERCETIVEKKDQEQWFWKITEYAERLLKNTEWLNWPQDVLESQRNWIGKSEGAEIDFWIVKNFEFKKIFIATTNKSKIERFKKLFKIIGLNVEVEQIPNYLEVEENGKNGLENSFKKLENLKGKFEFPIIAEDTEVFIDGENFNPTEVKRVVLEGKDEKSLTQEEIGKLMNDFYKNLAKKHGGKVDFYYQNNFTILFPDGSIKQAQGKREYILQSEEHSELDIWMPMRNLYISKITNKPSIQENFDLENIPEDYKKEFEPIVSALTEMLFEKEEKITVFTTRIDTIFSGTYIIMAPELDIVKKITTSENLENVKNYIEKTNKKSNIERMAVEKDKSGCFTGRYTINPATNELMPIWISDFVIGSYGTGIVFADAHDKRDFDFAKKYGIKLKTSIFSLDESVEKSKIKNLEECFEGEGILYNSKQFDGLTSSEARPKIINWLGERGVARRKTIYKLRDWCISRQRYWGPPIPMIYCENCKNQNPEKNMSGWVPVPESDLPVLLPEIPKFEDFIPDGSGKGPLQKQSDFVNVKCPVCGNPAKRETDVSDSFVDSSWYFLRYPSVGIDSKPFDYLEKPIIETIFPDEHTRNVLVEFRKLSKILEDAGIVFWVSGSIALNALNKGIYTKINDIDIVVEPENLKKVIEILEILGFEKSQKEHYPHNIEMTKGWIEIDIWSRSEILNRDFSKKEFSLNYKVNFAETSFHILPLSTMKEIYEGLVNYQYRIHKKQKDLDGLKVIEENLKILTNKWLPVGRYTGGKEHTVLHLLYSRFVNMVLNDLGYINFQEPFPEFKTNGLIVKDGAKMSKSKGNVVNPDIYIEKYGADTMRLYLRFLGKFDQGGDFRDSGIEGMYRFIKKVWGFFDKLSTDKIQNLNENTQFSLGESFVIEDANFNLSIVHKTIKKVGEDLENHSFNTAIAKIMEFVNWYKESENSLNLTIRIFVLETLAKLLAPFAPFIAEELWEKLGHKTSIHIELWPIYDKAKILDEIVRIVVQINGKLRAEFEIERDSDEKIVVEKAKSLPEVLKWILGKEIKKEIFVKNKLVNFVVL
ncbi:MAG: hypothetical protein Fur0024_4240 [Patescibacteria group bacterium]